MLERFEQAVTGYAWPLKGEIWLLCGGLTVEGASVGVGRKPFDVRESQPCPGLGMVGCVCGGGDEKWLNILLSG